MMREEHLLLWNHVYIKVIDVRHAAMEQGEELRSYRLPASAFLFAVRGSAQVWLDRHLYLSNRFHLFHGGKGMNLDILAEDEFEYYLILYKPTLALPCRQEIARLMEGNNPFHDQYAFAPHHPLALFDKVERLDKEWRQSVLVVKLQVKARFYQFVHEVLMQLHQQEVQPQKPDLVAQATRYIHEHYNDPLTLDSIAQALDCSAGHLSRMFKNKLQTSPMHYLGQIRVDRTMQLLLRTDATLQEIAEQVGFLDAHSLSRSFKKYKGVSPAQFRHKQHLHWPDRDLPVSMQRFAVQQTYLSPYTNTENHFQYKAGRELFMQKRAKIAAMTMVMCLSLLVGACSSPANTNTSAQAPLANPAEANTAPAKAAEQAEPQGKTRIVSTPKGDVEIPAEPKRVAADQYMGQLLKLGIVPVGVRSYMLEEGWFDKAGISKEVLAKIEDLGDFPMNLEKLAYLEPDLIIGSVEENIEQYQKVGTTVFVPYWEGETTAGPLEKFRKISDLFGKRQEAEAWIADYQQKVADAKKKLAGVVKAGETVSVVQFSDKAIYVMAAEGGNYGSSTIYQMLQLPPTKSAATMKEGYASISLEALPDYLGDHVFVYNGYAEATDQAMSTELWKNLPAVKKNQVYRYGNEFEDEFVMEDPYSLELQLDTIVNLLLAKQGGQGTAATPGT